MTETTWARLQRDFADLSEADVVTRQERLDAIRRENPARATQLERLLRADDAVATLSGSFGSAVAELLADHEADRRGERVGAFELEEQIGAGGMGVVYRARRVGDFEQTVAVKFLSRLIASPEMLERFATERQILARLEHPYIARLIDGGTTTSGEPYLVMEYVRGVGVLDYCAAHALGLRGRMRLFARIVQAVEFAHRSLVVHRDLKPGNILITDDGVPRLLDFGIASLVGGEAGRDAVVAMTPEYASPEQLADQNVTTASDVYALGAILHQMLTGRLPHAPDPMTVDTLRAAITREPPPQPSRTPLPGLRLGAEVDALTARALNPDPERRYGSAGDLLNDVRRFLDHQPLEAIGDAPTYRVACFLRRHAAASIVTGLALITVAGVSGIYVHQLQAARHAAEVEAAKAVQVADFMERLFEDVDPGETQGAELTAAQLLIQGKNRLESDLGTLPEVKTRLLGVIGRTWRRLGNFDAAYAAHEQAQLILDRDAIDDPAIRAQNRFDLAYAEYELGRVTEALAGHEAALSLRRSIHTEDHPDLADSLRETGLLRQQTGDLDGAAEHFEQARAMYDRMGTAYGSAEAATSMDLAGIAMARQNFDSAFHEAQRSLDVQLDLHGEIHPEVATATNNIAIILSRLNRLDEAAGMYERSLRIREQLYGSDNPITQRAHRNLALHYWRRGMLARAAVSYRAAAATWLAAEPSASLPLGYFQVVDYGSILLTLGDYAAAEKVVESVTNFAARAPDTQASDRARVHELQGRWLRATGRFSEAASEFREAAAWLRQDEAAWETDIERVLTFAEISDFEARPSPEALDALTRTVHAQLDDRQRPPTEAGSYLVALGQGQSTLGRTDAAAETARRLQDAVERIFETGSLEHAAFMIHAARWQIAAGQHDEIAAALEAAAIAALRAREQAGESFPLIESILADVANLRAELDG